MTELSAIKTTDNIYIYIYIYIYNLIKYHNFRPHQSLGYLTPNEYYQKTIGKTIARVLPM